LKILFLCTGNSCRSQMAEGWARALQGGEIEPYSAGVLAKKLDARAVKVMAEEGVDISAQRSKHVSELAGIVFDCVITVCDNARESCPLFPGDARTMHVAFEDPPHLARDAKSEEEALAHYRRVRDEIKEFIEKLPAVLARRGGD
jgi:arsenate reductase